MTIERSLALLVLLPGLFICAGARPPAADLSDLVQAGRVSEIEERLAGDSSANALHMLAVAQANHAAQLDESDERRRTFEDAAGRYERWIAALQRAAIDAASLPASVNLASAHAEFGAMIFGRWLTPDLDEFELSDGRRGDLKRLMQTLRKAREQFRQVSSIVDPLMAELAGGNREREEQYLALGVYDAIRSLHRDVLFQRAWVNLYLAMVSRTAGAVQPELLEHARRQFDEVLQLGLSGDTAARCELGLGMVAREQRRFEQAQRRLRRALEHAGDAALTVRIRYEKARTQIADGRFENARRTLEPLVGLNADATAETNARFYTNMAQLWDATAYLLQAKNLEQQAEDSGAQTVMRRRAGQLRETGLARLSRLALRGGPWPDLVRMYAADNLRLDADPDELSAAELLFSARLADQDGDQAKALQRLEAAAERTHVSAELRGEILFELAVRRARVAQPPSAGGESIAQSRAAADTFDQIVRELPTHARAAEAAGQAYRLRARIAEASNSADDYVRLADTLLRLIETFPEDERRSDAMWWLPVALESAGRYANRPATASKRYEQAAVQYASVPRDSPHWADAQYRAVLCARRAWRTAVEAGAEDLVPRGHQLASRLRAYAADAITRGGTGGSKEIERAADALLGAAEILGSVTLRDFEKARQTLDEFAQWFPERADDPRALALRVRVLLQLGRFDAAENALRRITAREGDAPADLAAVAAQVQADVERLSGSGRPQQAQRLAEAARPLFERLVAAAPRDGRSDEATQRRSDDAPEAVRFALARIRFLAGDAEAALPLVAALVEQQPQSGACRRLHAQVLTALADAAQTPARAHAAREAWAFVLRDPELRTRSPQRYWEARYEFLRLLLSEGKADQVARAIRQQQVWYPEMGGPDWRGRFDDLLKRATQPGSDHPEPD